MVGVGRRRKRAQACSKRVVPGETSHDTSQARVRYLLGEEVEEPVELVEVASPLGHERTGVDLRRLERSNVELQAVAKPLDPPEDADSVALAEALVEELDVVPDARLDAAARVDELEREVRRAALRTQTTLARDREDALDDPIFGELGDRRRDGHERRV